MAAFEARLQRKKAAELIPLVPRKNSVGVVKKTSGNKLKKRPSALTIHSDQSQASSSRPGTPTSQNSDSQRQPKKLRKRSHDFGRSSSESVHENLPVQLPPSPRPHMQAAVTKGECWDGVLPASEVAFHRHASRGKLGPPPSPSHGMRFDGVGVPKRGSPGKVVRVHPSQVGHLPPSPKMARPPLHDWEII